MTAPVLYWYRDDLRLADLPALAAAIACGGPVIPIYILDDRAAGTRALGGASRWWLHHSLAQLAEAIERLGGRLILRRGDSHDILPALLEQTGADRVFASTSEAPWLRRLDAALAKRVTLDQHAGATLFRPGEICTKSEAVYKVFSPFWRALKAHGEPPEPIAAPTRWPAPERWPDSDTLDSWALRPSNPDWAAEFSDHWTPGAAGAHARVGHFLEHICEDYKRLRDIPGIDGTSRLSPHLRFGEISPREVWHRTRPVCETSEPFLRELGWREFGYHLLHHMPHLPDEPMRPEFKAFPYRRDKTALARWQCGQTGYPIVDAGMRQLWRTGWLHNRVRMIVGSFLVKDLLLDWESGEAWFWDTLVDADPANNVMGWQWVAGCGPDAAPYFRIFNPVSQGERHDPDGAYVRRWVPELAGLPDSVIHKPWEASPMERDLAGVRLGKDYPEPMVDHKRAREAALEAYECVKQAKEQ